MILSRWYSAISYQRSVQLLRTDPQRISKSSVGKAKSTPLLQLWYDISVVSVVSYPVAIPD
ncbi:hypothetical protein [Moorena sp. SIO3H5]|uniref:hypothetical protein n=1 Tax=Moorena sp. SIO3H5 TaxID=2607834 RepID=UPI0013BB7082|nr:hypothetical protein [Moorena sp. SIO3H5]NEO73667.1 hypothetical protein [Moorena sp. SIO3H5]